MILSLVAKLGSGLEVPHRIFNDRPPSAMADLLTQTADPDRVVVPAFSGNGAEPALTTLIQQSCSAAGMGANCSHARK